ncbi:MAG: hypothetical protein IJQ55_04325 [Alphaproteobacteria bacterium]|nr:hypothetical protein [Alphaproteobacteria bacterium]
MKISRFLLKAIPYVLSIAGGVFVFDFSKKYLHDPSWIDLTNNISASLLAIPLVFLFYDYSNFLITRRMHKLQHTSVINILDGYLLKILGQMKNIIGLPRIEVPMQDINLNYKKLNLNKEYIRSIRKQLHLLEDLLYKSDKIEVLDPQHTQILSFVTQEINQILNEYKYHNSPREIARYIETTLSMIDDWFYSTGYVARKNTHSKNMKQHSKK